jgi:hypothetical protein
MDKWRESSRHSLTMSQAVRPAFTARPAVVYASDDPEVAVNRLSSQRAMEVNRVNTAQIGSSSSSSRARIAW